MAGPLGENGPDPAAAAAEAAEIGSREMMTAADMAVALDEVRAKLAGAHLVAEWLHGIDSRDLDRAMATWHPAGVLELHARRCAGRQQRNPGLPAEDLGGVSRAVSLGRQPRPHRDRRQHDARRVQDHRPVR